MSRTRHIVFLSLIGAAFLAAVGAAGIIVAAILPAASVPIASGLLRGSSDDDLLLAMAVAAIVPILVALAAWIASLDAGRPHRPRLLLYALGLAPGLLAAAATWGYLGGGSVSSGVEAVAASGGVLLATPLLFFLIEMALGMAVGTLARLLLRANWMAPASAATRLYQCFRPGHPDIDRAIGLIDFRRGRWDEAFPRLVKDLDRGLDDLQVVQAVWEMGLRRGDDELLIVTGGRILSAGQGVRLDKDAIHRRLAEAETARGRFPEALAHLEVAMDSENPVDLEEQARLLLQCGRFDDAAPVLRELEVHEGPPRARCVRLYQFVIDRREPDSLTLLRQAVEFFRRHKRMEEAGQVLELMLTLDSEDESLRDDLVVIYRATGHLARLAAHLAAKLTRGTGTVETAVELIKALLAQANFEDAEEVAKQQAEAHPEQFEFPYFLGSIALSMEDPTRARAHAAQAAALATPEQVEQLKPLQRKIDAALAARELEDLERRAGEAPEDVTLHMDLVRRLVRNGRLERATVEVDTLLSRNPGARDQVKQQLEELIAGNRKNFLLASYLSDLHLKDRDFDKAHALYSVLAELSFSPEQTLREGAEKILELAPDHIPSHRRLFEVGIKQEQWKEAAAHARRYLAAGGVLEFEERTRLFDAYCATQDIEHGGPLGRELLEEQPYVMPRTLQLARLFMDNNLFPDALTMLNKAKSMEPGNNDIYQMIEVARQKQREARSLELRQLIDKKPDDADLLNELADLLTDFKRYEDALRFYQRAAQATENSGQRMLCLTKLAWCMVKRHMFDTAVETVKEVPLSLTEERKVLADRKKLFYEMAETLESSNHFEESLDLYKQVFKVDAGFRHVLQKVEQLGR